MSKTNPPPATTAKVAVEKTTPVKATIKKTVTPKTVSPKSTVTKAVAAKPATASSATTTPSKVTAKKVIATKATKPVAKPVVKAVVKDKTPKLKMERDSFTMPKAEYAQLYVLKERLAKLGNPAKKSELLRAGIMQLTAMTDTALKAAMAKVPTIKTGRPKNK
jgi:hypothetical protein